MIVEEPYFMKNKEWYYHDEKEWKYKLTPKGEAIPEVVKSYKKYYEDEIDDEKVDFWQSSYFQAISNDGVSLKQFTK